MPSPFPGMDPTSKALSGAVCMWRWARKWRDSWRPRSGQNILCARHTALSLTCRKILPWPQAICTLMSMLLRLLHRKGVGLPRHWYCDTHRV